MFEHIQPSSYMYYTYEHWSLALETDSIFFVKHAILNTYRDG
jgi:hypothetical protein